MADRIRISRRKEYREFIRLYNNLSKNLNAKLKTLFKKTAKQAQSEFLRNKDMFYYFLEPFTDELYKILDNHYRNIISLVGERAKKQRQKQDDDIDEVINLYITTVLATQVTQISETTRKQIRDTIQRAIAGKIVIDGVAQTSIPQIAKLIQKNKAFSNFRATMIARTETHSTMNHANFEVSKKLGLKKPVKQWNSALDERTRSWHREMNAKKPIPINEMFIVNTPVAGGYFEPRPMRYTGDYQNGGPSNVINCRCFTLYYDSEDEIIE